MGNDGTEATRGLFQTIQAMSVSEKLDLARKGSKEARSILIRDSNKMIQLAIVQSPKITEGEVLMIASNRQIDAEVLKHIAISQEWMKNYQIRVALASNPKTPLAEAMKQIMYLKQRDLAVLAKSRSIPRALSVAAEQRLKQVKR
jgi:hypothetical protein